MHCIELTIYVDFMTYLRRKSTLGPKSTWMVHRIHFTNEINWKILSINVQQIVVFQIIDEAAMKFHSIDKCTWKTERERKNENIINTICEAIFSIVILLFPVCFVYVKSRYTLNKWESINVCFEHACASASVHFQKESQHFFPFLHRAITKHLLICTFIQVQSEWFFRCIFIRTRTYSLSIKTP